MEYGARLQEMVFAADTGLRFSTLITWFAQIHSQALEWDCPWEWTTDSQLHPAFANVLAGAPNESQWTLCLSTKYGASHSDLLEGRATLCRWIHDYPWFSEIGHQVQDGAQKCKVATEPVSASSIWFARFLCHPCFQTRFLFDPFWMWIT